VPTTNPDQGIDFRVRDTRCAAWLTLPPGSGPHPAVVLVHGLGATHDMRLPQYEQHFAAAGIATLAFDYQLHRGLRRSTTPNTSRPANSVDDVAAALEHLKSRPEIDGGRIGLWGNQPRRPLQQVLLEPRFTASCS